MLKIEIWESKLIQQNMCSHFVPNVFNIKHWLHHFKSKIRQPLSPLGPFHFLSYLSSYTSNLPKWFLKKHSFRFCFVFFCLVSSPFLWNNWVLFLFLSDFTTLINQNFTTYSYFYYYFKPFFFLNHLHPHLRGWGFYVQMIKRSRNL